MSCEVCEPIINGDKYDHVEFKDGHGDNHKVIIWNSGGHPKIAVYPKPYKASKFHSTRINHCPFCGTKLNYTHEANVDVKKDYSSKQLNLFEEGD